MNNSEVLHTERRAGKGESLFCQNAIYCRQLIYVATEHRQRERKEGKQGVTRGMSTTRKGLHGEAECTFAMHSKGEGSEQGRCSDEQEVSREDVVMSRKCPYGEGRHQGRCRR